VPDYRQKIAEFEREGLVKFENDKLALTDRWMDVASYVINELVK
jgi:coproporphyrinogen III oxidase-like Fe-S oxidoreductase